MSKLSLVLESLTCLSIVNMKGLTLLQICIKFSHLLGEAVFGHLSGEAVFGHLSGGGSFWSSVRGS